MLTPTNPLKLKSRRHSILTTPPHSQGAVFARRLWVSLLIVMLSLLGGLGDTDAQELRLLVSSPSNDPDRDQDQVLLYNGINGKFLDAFVLSASGGLKRPRSLIFGPGPNGDLYVSSELSRGPIMRYDGDTGAFKGPFVQFGVGGLRFPRGLTFGPGGDLFVSSQKNNRIVRYNGTTGALVNIFVPDGDGDLNAPEGLTFGNDGHLYVSSSANDQILRYHGVTGEPMGPFVQNLEGVLDAPIGLIFGPDNHLYVSSSANHQVLLYNGTTGAFMGAFVQAGASPLNSPHDLVFGPDNHLYVNSLANNQVFRYNGTTGAFMGAFVQRGLGDLSEPRGLAFGPRKHLYISSFTNDRILRYDGRLGTFIDAFVQDTSGGLASPQGLAIGPDKKLYVSSSINNQVLRYDGATGDFTGIFVQAGSGGLSSPTGLTFDLDGNLLVSSSANNQILRYNGETGAFDGMLAPAGSDQLNSPQGLTFGPDQHLYVSSLANDRVLRYDDISGEFTDFVKEGGGDLDAPLGLTFGPDGDLYVSSSANDQILRYHGMTGEPMGAFVPAGSVELDAPAGLLFGGPDQDLYVSSLKTDRLLRYDGRDGTFLGAFVPPKQGGLTGPSYFVFQELQQVTVPLTVTTTGSGTVFSLPSGIDCSPQCSYHFPRGNVVTLAAAADPDSLFVGWQGNGCAGTGPCTVSLTDPLVVTAAFNNKPLGDQSLLSVMRAGEGAGSVTSVPPGIQCGNDCSHDFPPGTLVTLNAVPTMQSVFAGWGGGACSGTGPCRVSLSASSTVTAVFEPSPLAAQHPLAVVKTGSGSGQVISVTDGINCGAKCSHDFPNDTPVTLVAAADPNSRFAGWDIAGCAATPRCELTLAQPRSITARFDRIALPKLLTVKKMGSGTGQVTSQPPGIQCGGICVGNFPDSAIVTLTAAPMGESVFNGWGIKLCSGVGPCKITMAEARTIRAFFDPDPTPSSE